MSDQKDNFVKINDTFYDLNSIEIFAWKKLLNGSVKKKNGFRTMCVGTIGEQNDASLRIVINRKVNESQKTIYFYTDNRSRKFEDLQRDNRITLLFYDAKQRVQIVIKATVKIYTNDALSNDRWNTSNPQARLGYMTIKAPNTKSQTPTLGYDAKFSEIKPTGVESDLFQENFAVIVCHVCELEFLYLDYLGNRKANYFYKNGVLVDSFWVVP